MGNVIDKSTQLTIFETIRDSLLSNSVISSKFSQSDFYQWEPKLKGASTKVPYIVIKIPTTSTEFIVMDHDNRLKELSVELIMVLDYEARDNFITYANAIINQFESATTTFEGVGYYNSRIDLESNVEEIIDQKDVVTGTFSLMFNGWVNRS